MIWEIPVEAVEWQDGKAFPAGSNAGEFDPLELACDRTEGRRARVARSTPRYR